MPVTLARCVKYIVKHPVCVNNVNIYNEITHFVNELELFNSFSKYVNRRDVKKILGAFTILPVVKMIFVYWYHCLPKVLLVASEL
jgi:hypothetical protein